MSTVKVLKDKNAASDCVILINDNKNMVYVEICHVELLIFEIFVMLNLQNKRI